MKKLVLFALLKLVIVTSLILDNKHTLRYDGEVNIGKILLALSIIWANLTYWCDGYVLSLRQFSILAHPQNVAQFKASQKRLSDLKIIILFMKVKTKSLKTSKSL